MTEFDQIMPIIILIVIFLFILVVLYKIWGWVLGLKVGSSADDDRRYINIPYDYDDEDDDDVAIPPAKKTYDVSAYAKKDSLLSPAEVNFYHVLKQVIGDSAVISPKVNLWDVFYIKRNSSKNFMALKAKIDRKHVDFLICHAQTLEPLIGIELDDRSHQRADRQKRDSFVDSVFKSANLPIIHIPVRHGYNVNTITDLLKNHLIEAKVSTQQNNIPDNICPKCGGDLVVRRVKSGKNAGIKFLGCSNYPNCRYMTPYKE